MGAGQLLRTIFAYGHDNDYELLYVTVFPRHEALVHFLQQFGFTHLSTKTKLGEDEYVKRMRAQLSEKGETDALEYHIRYGPYAWKWDENAGWIVPIRPQYHQILFPGTGVQQPLLPGYHPSGNSIRKAYLSSAGGRQISPGDLLLFYRSRDVRALTVVGVAEKTLVSTSPDNIAGFVGKRTVYPYNDIEAMCTGEKTVLAVLFRYAHDVRTPITYAELTQHGLLTAPPQSIQQIRKGTISWLRKRLSQR